MSQVIWRPMAIEIGIVFAVGVGVGWAGHAILTSPDRAKFTDLVQRDSTEVKPVERDDPLVTYGKGRVTINLRRNKRA